MRLTFVVIYSFIFKPLGTHIFFHSVSLARYCSVDSFFVLFSIRICLVMLRIVVVFITDVTAGCWLMMLMMMLMIVIVFSFFFAPFVFG